ncbi:MAG TPA: hypothetical protein VKC61_13640 [Pyrinomonadaceae bacterium]|nr:hypothetical protein [Pyrinomonadaceae bacterium]
MIRLVAALFLLGSVVGILGSPWPALGQQAEIVPQYATLVARRYIDGSDNYELAAFSFKYGGNGLVTRTLTRNNWDILFGNALDRDIFDVTMVVDDCSSDQGFG